MPESLTLAWFCAAGFFGACVFLWIELRSILRDLVDTRDELQAANERADEWKARHRYVSDELQCLRRQIKSQEPPA